MKFIGIIIILKCIILTNKTEKLVVCWKFPKKFNMRIIKHCKHYIYKMENSKDTKKNILG